jgi:hypothetical protein
MWQEADCASTFLGDERNWLARPVSMMVGYDNLIYGKGLPVPGTTDGVLAEDMPEQLRKE